MNKRTFLKAALAAPFLVSRRAAAEGPTAEAGAIAAQVSGRVNIGLDGIAEVIVYFLFVDGIGSDLFSGPPSERTAHFTLRADRLRPILTPNADMIHIGFQPAGNEGLYRVYYNPSPTNRDFSQPETFSQGSRIAVFKARRTQATVVPGSHTLVTGTADLVESTEVTFKDAAFDIGGAYRVTSFTFHAKALSIADLGVTTLSIPLGGHLIKVR